MSHSHKSSRVLQVLAIAIVLVVLTWAGLRANAAWHFRAAQNTAAEMYDSNQASVPKIREATERVRLALKYFPDNPDYLDLAGSLQMMHASQPGVVGGESRELLESAADNFRRALTVRPLWPYSWGKPFGRERQAGAGGFGV